MAPTGDKLHLVITADIDVAIENQKKILNLPFRRKLHRRVDRSISVAAFIRCRLPLPGCIDCFARAPSDMVSPWRVSLLREPTVFCKAGGVKFACSVRSKSLRSDDVLFFDSMLSSPHCPLTSDPLTPGTYETHPHAPGSALVCERLVLREARLHRYAARRPLGLGATRPR